MQCRPQLCKSASRQLLWDFQGVLTVTNISEDCGCNLHTCQRMKAHSSSAIQGNVVAILGKWLSA